MSATLDQLGDFGIVPVITIDEPAVAGRLAHALVAGGLPCAEITFRTSAAVAAIAGMLDTQPNMCVGAGSVLTVEQAEAAKKAGATFIVSPGFDPAVVSWCEAAGVPVVPGVMTPTELGAALSHGLDLVKFFPAGPAGGAPALRALSGPYPGVRFLPTGGINVENLSDYLALPMVHACGGSWIADRFALANADFAKISERARQAVEIARVARTVAGS